MRFRAPALFSNCSEQFVFLLFSFSPLILACVSGTESLG
jgi:hypothetical protein